MSLPNIQGEFRLVDDPELRFAPSGTPVARMRLAANSRKYDEATKEWKDDKVVYLRAVAFKKVAENIAESCAKGTLVTVSGRLETETWSKEDGTTGQAWTVLVDSFGLALTWDAARKVEAAAKGEQQTAAAPAGGGDPWNAPTAEEPPF